MPPFLSGPGLGLPYPQNLYPSELSNSPQDASSNWIGLAPGDAFVLPAGDWYVDPGQYSVIQYLDPVTGTWTMGTAAGWGSLEHVTSDGFNCRVANLTGCPVGAVVTAAGNGSYVQSSTTVTAVGSNSTWQPIVGGLLVMSTAVSNGAGYGVAPIVYVPPPPPAANNPNGVGGIQAAAVATIAGGTVSTISFINPGAGYPAAPSIVIMPHPSDPNLATGITQASWVCTVGAAGSITGVLCTNSGSALLTVANITLTVAGAGTGGTVSAVLLQSITSASVTLGTGFAQSVNVPLLSGAGSWPTSTFTNSAETLFLKFRPRPAQMSVFAAQGGTLAAGTAASIYDGGLFASTPSGGVVSTGGLPSTVPSVVLVAGPVRDIVKVQGAP